jgi:hypothetical protein
MTMSTTKRDDMRALLKTFGIQADEAVIAHLARNTQLKGLRVRLSLEDLTDYRGGEPNGALALIVEGQIENRT